MSSTKDNGEGKPLDPSKTNGSSPPAESEGNVIRLNLTPQARARAMAAGPASEAAYIEDDDERLAQVEAALEALGSETDGEGMWTCPAHEDDRPSLQVNLGDTGAVTMTCHAGCEWDALVAAIGLPLSGYFPPPGSKPHIATTRPKRKPTAGRSRTTTPKPAVKSHKGFTYADAEGNPVIRVTRINYADGSKTFTTSLAGRKDAQGKPLTIKVAEANGETITRPLYNLSSVLDAIETYGEPVWIVEGEASADAINSDGENVATTNLGGAGKWRDSYTETLRGAVLVNIVADNDGPGFKHARQVAESCRAAGLKVAIWRSATDGKGDDVVEHLAAGGDLSNLRPMTLDDLAAPATEPVDVTSRYYALGQRLSRDELRGLPRPTPLIKGVLDLHTTVMLIGATGTNKTFAALGWLLSVATGEPWLDHAVRIEPSPVLLVVGEGGSGLDQRIAAWEQFHGVTVAPEMLTILLRPYSVADAEFWEQVTALAVEIGARLVVLDTFSSLAPEADEVIDAAKVIRGMGELKDAIGGTVVLAHHTGWANKGRARNASQFEANPDAVIVMQTHDESEDSGLPVELWRKKVKDGEDGYKVWLQRRTLDLSETLGYDDDGDAVTSCVLELTEAPARRGVTAGGIEAAIRSVLSDHDPFTLTSEGVVTKVGGNKATTRKALKAMIDSGQCSVRNSEALEGSRMVTRERVGLERVRLPAATRSDDGNELGGVR